MVEFSGTDIMGSGTRTIKLHWKSDTNPQVYISGWELRTPYYWDMVIYKLKNNVQPGCTDGFEVQQRFAIRSRSERHYETNSPYYNDWATRRCDTTSCYGHWFSDFDSGSQDLAVPVMAAITDRIWQQDYDEHKQNIWLFRNVAD